MFSGPGPVMTLEGVAECYGAGTCAAGGGGGACPELGSNPCLASVHLYSLLATLEDDSAPTATVLGGSLLESGTLSGSVGVGFEGEDTGGGLASAAVTVDGTVVATSDFGGDPSRCDPLVAASATNVSPLYAWGVPCPLIAHTELSFDTARLADGIHVVAVTETDAAGNVATVWSGAIHTANAVASPAAPAGPGSGAAAQASGRAPGCLMPKVTASVADAAGAALRFGARATLRGVLRCGSEPIAGARLTVESRMLDAAGSWRAQAVVTTGRDGTFAYEVAGGPSRRLLVNYRPPGRVGRASAEVTVAVAPPITLTITPTRTTNGHTIAFSGVIGGGHQPAGGVPVEFEYLEAGRWMIYDVVHTDPSSGRFFYRYTFHRTTRPITYTFRFALPASGVTGYPFAPSASPARSVHVDP